MSSFPRTTPPLFPVISSSLSSSSSSSHATPAWGFPDTHTLSLRASTLLQTASSMSSSASSILSSRLRSILVWSLPRVPKARRKAITEAIARRKSLLATRAARAFLLDTHSNVGERSVHAQRNLADDVEAAKEEERGERLESSQSEMEDTARRFEMDVDGVSSGSPSGVDGRGDDGETMEEEMDWSSEQEGEKENDTDDDGGGDDDAVKEGNVRGRGRKRLRKGTKRKSAVKEESTERDADTNQPHRQLSNESIDASASDEKNRLEEIDTRLKRIEEEKETLLESKEKLFTLLKSLLFEEGRQRSESIVLESMADSNVPSTDSNIDTSSSPSGSDVRALPVVTRSPKASSGSSPRGSATRDVSDLNSSGTQYMRHNPHNPHRPHHHHSPQMQGLNSSATSVPHLEIPEISRSLIRTGVPANALSSSISRNTRTSEGDKVDISLLGIRRHRASG